MREAGVASVAAAGAFAPSVEVAAAAGRRACRRPTVAVFGGGIAGLTAAHELAERGFAVTVYERRAWGGKARSTWVPGTAAGGRLPLPGEHGWRTFFGFYQNTVETMRRIPFGSNPNGVFDNLAGASAVELTQTSGRPNLVVSLGTDRSTGFAPGFLTGLSAGLTIDTDITAAAVAYFFTRLIVYLSSCEARRLGQWEHTAWTTFTASDHFGDDYRRILVNSFSEVVQASKAERTSAEFCGRVLELLVYNALGRYSNGQIFRFLNRPSNEALFNPWLALLRSHGVQLRVPYELVGLNMRGGRIAAARVRTPTGEKDVEANWYLLAVPVERARRLWTPAILKADPQLERMRELDTGWMNGLKFFLRQPTPIVNGSVEYVDSPWELTSVSQAQFWPVDFAATYGDGRTLESLSVIISNWNTPGIVFDKPARECTPQQVVTEAWEQMKAHLNKPGRGPILTDDLIVTTDIDQGMVRRGGRLISGDPLVLPTVGQRSNRPGTTTAIPNLLLAGDYLNTDLQVANMEAASYNGRTAANAILAASRPSAEPAAIFNPPQPPEWNELKQTDAARYASGQPNLLDVPPDSPVTTLLGLMPSIPTPFSDILRRLAGPLTGPAH